MTFSKDVYWSLAVTNNIFKDYEESENLKVVTTYLFAYVVFDAYKTRFSEKEYNRLFKLIDSKKFTQPSDEEIKKDLEEKKERNLPTGWIPFTSQFEKILQASNIIASDHDSEVVTLDHIMTAIVNSGREASEIFWDIDFMNLNWIKNESMITPEKIIEKKELSTKNLDQYTVNLNVKLQNSIVKKEITWRDKELKRIIQILSRRSKNNVLVLWESWVWKTALIEWLAHLINSWIVTPFLRDKVIYSLDSTTLTAWAGVVWVFEKKVLAIVEEIKQSDWRFILFLDDMHTIMGDKNNNWPKLGDVLKPALNRNEITVIWVTNFKEFKVSIERDPALVRSFSKVNIKEPTTQETLVILRAIKSTYENFHGVQIEDEALKRIVDLAELYFPERNFPDKAIDLLDEGLSFLKMNSVSKSPKLIELEDKKINLEVDYEYEKNPIKKKKIGEKLKSINTEVKDLSVIYDEKVKKIKELHILGTKIEEITTQISEIEDSETSDERIDELVELKYKKLVPLEKEYERLSTSPINEKLTSWVINTLVENIKGVELDDELSTTKDKYAKMSQYLNSTVIWQWEGIEKILRTLKRRETGLWDHSKPIWSFMLLWPTWVGKTYIAKQLNKQLFGQSKKLVRLDMSEFMEKQSVSRLVGSPPGYVDSDKWWELTEAVKQDPYSIILFDEIEKAHKDVYNILLQILDDWRLTDSLWEEVDFKNTIIFLTTNVWAYDIIEYSRRKKSMNEILEKIQPEMEKQFRPEFLNRLNELLIFRSLSLDVVETIIEKELDNIQSRVLEKWNDLKYNKSFVTYIAKEAYSEEYGTRPVKRYVERNILDKIVNFYLDEEIKQGQVFSLSFDIKTKIVVVNLEEKKVIKRKTVKKEV